MDLHFQIGNVLVLGNDNGYRGCDAEKDVFAFNEVPQCNYGTLLKVKLFRNRPSTCRERVRTKSSSRLAIPFGHVQIQVAAEPRMVYPLPETRRGSSIETASPKSQI